MILHPRLETLDRYRENLLSAGRRRRLAAHLEQCESCRRRLGALEQIETALIPELELPAETTSSLMARLGEPQWRSEPAIVEIKRLSGPCRIEPEHGVRPVDAFEGLGLRAGDLLRLEAGSRALLELYDGSRIWLNENTVIGLRMDEHDLRLEAGMLFARIKPQAREFTIGTPAASLAVIGTTFEAGLTPYDSTFLKVLSGRVAFRNEAGQTLISRRSQVDAAAHQPPTPLRIPASEAVGTWRRELELTEPETVRPTMIGTRRLIWTLTTFVLLLLATFGGYYLRGTLRSSPEGRESPYEPPQYFTVIPDATLTIAGLNWPIGTRFVHRLEVSFQSESILPLSGEVAVQELKQTQDVIFHVLNRSRGGDLEMDVSFANIKIEVKQGDNQFYLDSTSDVPDDIQHPFAAIMRAQLGARFRIVIDKHGEVRLLEGYEEFKQSLLAASSSEASALIGRMLHGDYYRQMLNICR